MGIARQSVEGVIGDWVERVDSALPEGWTTDEDLFRDPNRYAASLGLSGPRQWLVMSGYLGTDVAALNGKVEELIRRLGERRLGREGTTLVLWMYKEGIDSAREQILRNVREWGKNDSSVWGGPFFRIVYRRFHWIWENRYLGRACAWYQKRRSVSVFDYLRQRGYSDTELRIHHRLIQDTLCELAGL